MIRKKIMKDRTAANSSLQQCNFQKLEALLSGTLSDDELLRVEAHLSECASCAARLQSAAVSNASWELTKSLMHADEFDCPHELSSMPSRSVDDGAPMTKIQTADVLTREIRGWLDPTDDPQSLGRFAGYEIVGIIGHGGMGIVLKGFEASLHRFVAIKVLAPRLATNGNARHRFAREAQAAAAVRHENVIAIHRVDDWHGLPFLVMPYVGGLSLQKRLDNEGPMTIEQTLCVGLQISAGLAAAHAQGLVHRDIKPANILLEKGVERVTITDFGLARAVDDASLTRTGVIAGTPQYMSPEQAEGKPLDSRSDLFSLGSVLYTMATGRAPFRGDGSMDVLNRIVHGSASSMQRADPMIPDWFDSIVQRLHAKLPSDRPQSANEVTSLLETCLSHVRNPSKNNLPTSLQEHRTAGRFMRRPPYIMALGASALAFFVFLLGTIIVIETNKGTLKIECDVDKVPIRIRQGDKIIDQLEVTKAGNTIRVASGIYTIEIDGEFDTLFVLDGRVDLQRGGTAIVKIQQSNAAADQASVPKTPLPGNKISDGSDTNELFKVVSVPTEKEQEMLAQAAEGLHSNGLIGTVDISFVPEMGLTIIKGNKNDVQRVQDVIERIKNQTSASLDITQDSLSLAVDEFNRTVDNEPLSKQPPLSKAEVIAYASWTYNTNKDLSTPVKSCLHQLAQYHRLPAGWKFQGGKRMVSIKDKTLEVFEIELFHEFSKSKAMVRQRFLKPTSSPTLWQGGGPGAGGGQGGRRGGGPDGAGGASIEGRPLAAAIRTFNAQHREVDGQSQPQLTEDEVIAAILFWQTKRDEADIDDALFEQFQRIARTRKLPRGTELELISGFGSVYGATHTIWSIRVRMPKIEEQKRGGTYAFIVRDQYISVKHVDASSLHWGTPGENGLQVGVRLSPALASYELGQVIEVEFFFRNVLGKPLDGMLPNIMSFDAIEVTDQHGHPMEVRKGSSLELIAGAQGLSFGDEPISRKSKSLMIAAPSTIDKVIGDHIGIIARAGQKCSATFTLRNFATNAQGVLITGVIEFEVKDAIPTQIRFESDIGVDHKSGWPGGWAGR